MTRATCSSPFPVALALAVATAAGVACVEDAEPPAAGPLEIGLVKGETFTPLADGDAVPVILGANGLNMIQPSLRALDIDPRAPDPTVTIEVGGFVMAADIEGTQADMKSDGVGYVLRDLRVPFQTDLCCFVCRDGKVLSKLRDVTGRMFESTVSLRFERGGCPDEAACCTQADACPDPALTQVCK